MRPVIMQTADGVYMPVPGFYEQGGKYFLFEDMIEAAVGEKVRFDMVVKQLVEETGLEPYLIERVKTRVDG